MWDSENERLGMKSCTPLGYAVRCLADLIGLIGIVGFLVLFLCLLKHVGGLSWATLLVPIGMGVLGKFLLYAVSWKLAERKQFHYNPELRIARWIESGEARQFPPQ